MSIQTGVNVSKANGYAVAASVQDGVNVSKANGYVVTRPTAIGISVLKANGYAVVIGIGSSAPSQIHQLVIL